VATIAGGFLAVRNAEGDDEAADSSRSSTDEASGQADEESAPGAVGGAADVVCTDLVGSTLQSAWQDADGAIRATVLVDNGCEIGQRLDDPSVAFALTGNGVTVADATFDFSSRPVVVPAFGRGEAEIVFGPETFVDLAAIETLGLGGDAMAGTSSLGLTYSYVCTDAPGASAPSAGGEVAGVATGTPVTPGALTESDALARLQEISAADRDLVESEVVNRWVPQISSKKPDVTLPNGTVWDAVSILDDHRAWRQRFPRVRLLWSGDYSTFEAADFWVTIVAVPFDSPEGALGWCDMQALPAEDCYAKLVSHTHPNEGSTELR
jgi:hypothetical protein